MNGRQLSGMAVLLPDESVWGVMRRRALFRYHLKRWLRNTPIPDFDTPDYTPFLERLRQADRA
jgi:hypothetical protein